MTQQRCKQLIADPQTIEIELTPRYIDGEPNPAAYPHPHFGYVLRPGEHVQHILTRQKATVMSSANEWNGKQTVVLIDLKGLTFPATQSAWTLYLPDEIEANIAARRAQS